MTVSAPAAASPGGFVRYVFRSVPLSASSNSGWTRAGDMDGDGDLDIVTGGGDSLFVFENNGNAGGWTRFGNLDSTGAMGANGGVLYDLDGDGDLDVVSAKFYDDVGWWENPVGQQGVLTNAAWTFHLIANFNNLYTHDLILAELDDDPSTPEFIANLQTSYSNARIFVSWFRPGADPTGAWQQHVIEDGPNGTGRPEGAAHGHAGLDVGDIDGDGALDLAYSNGWYEAPTSNAAGSWTWHPVTGLYGVSNTLLRDMDGDGDLDLVMGAGHHGSGVYWYENALPGAWTEHVVDPDVLHPEGLAVQDLDGDGRYEIVAAELFFDAWDETVHNLYVYQERSSTGIWLRHEVSPDHRNNHLLQLVDIDQDCRPDVLSQTAGDTWVSLYRNVTRALEGCP